MTLLWILLAISAGTFLALILASTFLLFPESTRKSILPALISFATGALLGAAFLGVLPRAFLELGSSKALMTLLVGILFFFLMEKLIIWRHCHKEGCHSAHSSAGPLIILGDAFHNFIDGIVIAGAFLISPSLGITTSVAIISHEVPQEVGDYAILLHSGYSRKRALLLNLYSGITALLGGLIGYYFLGEVRWLIPYVMGISAAGFIYIAVADLVPSLHKETKTKESLLQLLYLGLGVGVIFILRSH